MTRKKRKKRPPRRQRRPVSGYRRSLREADEVLARNDVEIREDNWRELAFDWFAPEEPARGMLAGCIAEHEHELGVAWAREVLRMMVMYRAQDYGRILQHYDRAFSGYPPCALIEIWVARQVVRRLGDFWRAREISRRAIELAPHYPHAYFDMGFMHFLLGDFPGALSWFDEAAERVTGTYAEVAARTYFNRGLTRYYLDRDREGAMADIEEVLRHKPDDAEAEQMLQQLRGKQEGRVTPWQTTVP